MCVLVCVCICMFLYVCVCIVNMYVCMCLLCMHVCMWVALFINYCMILCKIVEVVITPFALWKLYTIAQFYIIILVVLRLLCIL